MLEKLTHREQQTIKLYAETGNTRIVAASLGIAYRTVECYLTNIRVKLQVNSSLEAIALLFDKIDFAIKDMRNFRLTKREIEILELIKLRKNNQEIANELIITIKTVETHLSSVLRKTELKNRYQLFTYLRLYPEKFTHYKNTKYNRIIKLKKEGLKPKQIAERIGVTVEYVYFCKEVT